jgi:hypothetical protein
VKKSGRRVLLFSITDRGHMAATVEAAFQLLALCSILISVK